jgi:NAD(P)-dependent dehydrogenase (short-subunit alcohol dehydrogenase family)
MAFEGKVALITGGGSGMGQVAAWKLADTGAEVVIVDVDEAGMKETASDRPNIHPIVCDVSDLDRVEEVVEEIEGNFGPIDRVMHAAGVMPDGYLLEEDVGKVRKVFDINFFGTVHLAKTVLNRMAKRGSGEFVVFGSSAGYIPAPRMSTYCSTKAAVNMYMDIAHYETRHSGARTMVVCPGIVKTPLLEQASSMKFTTPERSKSGATPEQVVDNIEKSLSKGEYICVPDKGGRISLFLRRYFPKLTWKLTLKSEGLS